MFPKIGVRYPKTIGVPIKHHKFWMIGGFHILGHLHLCIANSLAVSTEILSCRNSFTTKLWLSNPYIESMFTFHQVHLG